MLYVRNHIVIQDSRIFLLKIFLYYIFNLNVYFKNLFYFDILNIKKYNIYINNNSK